MYDDTIEAANLIIEGPSLDSCKQKLYEKFGNNYNIVNHKTIMKGGFLGFGQKELVKVTYIVRQNNIQQSLSTRNDAANFLKSRDNLLQKADPSITSNLQIAQLSKKFDQFTEEMTKKIGTISEVTSIQEKHPSIKKIEELLQQNEFSISYIKSISERIRNTFSLEELDNFDEIQKTVIDWIGEGICIAKQTSFRPPHVIIVVGPTGVGKTTTVAKLAANIILDSKKKKESTRPEIRLVTIDSMRVGAEVQLERYGEIMGVDVNKAENADDLKQLFETYKSKLDYMLIDTSGFSPNDFENIGKMRSVLEVPNLKSDVYLAVTAGVKAHDLERILKNYETFNYQSIIITKCDETVTYGNVLSVLIEQHKPISWITDGQNVPRFIERASTIKFLTNLIDFTVDRKHIEEKFNSQEN